MLIKLNESIKLHFTGDIQLLHIIKINYLLYLEGAFNALHGTFPFTNLTFGCFTVLHSGIC